jgi:hypothetical protein
MYSKIAGAAAAGLAPQPNSTVFAAASAAKRLIHRSVLVSARLHIISNVNSTIIARPTYSAASMPLSAAERISSSVHAAEPGMHYSGSHHLLPQQLLTTSVCLSLLHCNCRLHAGAQQPWVKAPTRLTTTLM